MYPRVPSARKRVVWLENVAFEPFTKKNKMNTSEFEGNIISLKSSWREMPSGVPPVGVNELFLCLFTISCFRVDFNSREKPLSVAYQIFIRGGKLDQNS